MSEDGVIDKPRGQNMPFSENQLKAVFKNPENGVARGLAHLGLKDEFVNDLAPIIERVVSTGKVHTPDVYVSAWYLYVCEMKSAKTVAVLLSIGFGTVRSWSQKDGIWAKHRRKYTRGTLAHIVDDQAAQSVIHSVNYVSKQQGLVGNAQDILGNVFSVAEHASNILLEKASKLPADADQTKIAELMKELNDNAKVIKQLAQTSKTIGDAGKVLYPEEEIKNNQEDMRSRITVDEEDTTDEKIKSIIKASGAPYNRGSESEGEDTESDGDTKVDAPATSSPPLHGNGGAESPKTTGSDVHGAGDGQLHGLNDW